MASGKAAFITLILSLLICEASTIAGTRTINPVDTLDPWDWRAYDWGPMVNGVAMRMITRPEIAYGEPLEMFVEIKVDTAQVRARDFKCAWNVRGLPFSLRILAIDGKEQTSSEIHYPRATVPDGMNWGKSASSSSLTHASPKLVYELGHVWIGSPTMVTPSGEQIMPEKVARVVSRAPGSYVWEVSLSLPNKGVHCWKGTITACCAVEITEVANVKHEIRIIVPSFDRTCDTCHFGIATDTISLYARPDFYLCFAVNTYRDGRLSSGVQHGFSRRRRDEPIDFCNDIFENYNSLDTSAPESVIKRIILFETSGPPGHLSPPKVSGSGALWTASFNAVLDKRAVKSIHPVPDSIIEQLH